MTPRHRANRTLALATILHAFTHAYGAMLVPLYLLMVADLGLAGVKSASFIVTVYGLVYCLGSYGAGILADRHDRKWLLGIGLIGNAIAIGLMGLTHSYALLIALAAMAGIFGTLFHPAANALAPAHYPNSPGMAIGLLGIGSGIGFFAGPQIAGWRASSALWHWGAMSDWQRPCVELGVAGVLFGIVWLIFGSEARHRHTEGVMPPRLAADALNIQTVPAEHHVPLGRSLRRKVIVLACVLGMRDFAGVASLSLASIFLQKAQGLDVRQTGFIVGMMMLIGVVANPAAVFFSHGKRRLPALAGVLVLGGLAIAATPWVSAGWVLAVLCLFQACQLGSYAMSDAAMLERVDARLRGRVVGLFLTLAGTAGSLGPWAMGYWTDGLGVGASDPRRYAWTFGTLGLAMIAASFSTPLLARLGTER